MADLVGDVVGLDGDVRGLVGDVVGLDGDVRGLDGTVADLDSYLDGKADDQEGELFGKVEYQATSYSSGVWPGWRAAVTGRSYNRRWETGTVRWGGRDR